VNGTSLLIIEDEVVIAFDLADAFVRRGASVTATSTLRHAVTVVEHHKIAAAIIDHRIANSDSRALCARLEQLGIPFVLYTGDLKARSDHPNARLVRKPAAPEAVVAATEALLETRRETS
jgi:DNA-binding NtrC family response regulator